jgi:drug/metabolite transporter (DMT)-like permease
MGRLSGVFLILISAVSFGTMPIFARMAYAAGSDPITVLFIRYLIAGVILVLITRIENKPLPRGKVLLGLVGMGVFGYVGQSFFYFNALNLASTSLVALILYLYPVLVTFFSVVLFKEKLTVVKAAALALAMVGAVLTIGPTGGGRPLGVVMAFIAATIYSIYILVGSRILKYAGAIQATTIIIVSSLFVYSGLASWQGIHLPQTSLGWIGAVGVAIICTVVAALTFLAGLQRIGPSNTATLSTAEPVTSVFLASLLLHDSLTPLRLLGGALILAAVVILTRGGAAASAPARLELQDPKGYQKL